MADPTGGGDTPAPGAPDPGPPTGTPGGDGVAEVANLFLGNILYAIELAALALEDQGKGEDAAFYRGIARKLAEARGRDRGAGRG
jgi:hypothetical protein